MATATDAELETLAEYDQGVPITLNVEVLQPQPHGGNYVIVKRWLSPKEIQAQLHKALDIRVCQKCKHESSNDRSNWDTPCPECGGDDHNSLIEEYDSSCHFGDDETKPIAPRTSFCNGIMVWCEPGSNEGYSIYVTLRMVDREDYSRNKVRMVDVYRIKCWSGMRFCHNVTERIMRLMGVWTRQD